MRVLAVMWAAVVIAVAGLYLGRRRAREVSRRPMLLARPARAASVPPVPEPIPDPHIPEGPARAYRGDARHTGRSPYRGPRAPVLYWAYETGGRITSQAVVDSKGRVYVGAHDGYLHALAADGTLRFRRYLGDGEHDARRRAEERVYATGLLDEQGYLYVGSDSGWFWSLTTDGAVRFKMRTEGDVDTGVVRSPAGHVLFASGRQVFALKPEGEVHWHYDAGGKVYASPAVAPDGTVYCGAQDDQLYALGPDGALRWRYTAGGDVDSAPVVGDDGSIYFGADDRRVHALTPGGEVLWVTQLEGYVRAPLALGLAGEVYAVTYGPRPALVALSARTGDLLWSFPVSVTDSAEVGLASAPLVDVDGQLYFGSHDDRIYSVSPAGTLRWTYETAGDVDAPPILRSDGTLLVGADDGHLYALRDP